MRASAIVPPRRWVGFLVACLLVGLAVAPTPVAAADPAWVATYTSSAPVAAVSAGEVHTCAIRTDGTLACWGSDDYGDMQPPDGGTYTAVSAGDSDGYTCAIRTDGTLACWYTSGPSETRPAGTYTAVDVSEDWGTACAIRDDGTLACWGFPGGDVAPPAGTFTAVSMAAEFACAIRTDGTLACWRLTPSIRCGSSRRRGRSPR